MGRGRKGNNGGEGVTDIYTYTQLKSIRIHLSPGSSCGLVAYTCIMVFMGHTAIF